MRRRHRHGYHTVQSTHPTMGMLRSFIGVVLIVIILYVAGKWILNLFGVQDSSQRTAVLLQTEDRGSVNISLDGGPMKRTDSDLKLYSNDSIETGSASHASLTFFDGTYVRLDENTKLEILRSERGEESSIQLSLAAGTIWFSSPSLQVFSGSVARMVETPEMTLDVPPGTESVLGTSSLTVFTADGPGLTLEFANTKGTIIVGEGQKFTLPDTVSDSIDLYAYRSPLDPQMMQSPFVEGSKEIYAAHIPAATPTTDGETTLPAQDKILVVTTPQQEEIVNESVVTVTGTVNPTVTAVRVNGYQAALDQGEFSLQVALADQDESTITIEALDANAAIVAEVARKVFRNREPPEPPTITRPAQGGQTYYTNQEAFEISGTAPKGAVGIIVNDYRLQLFSPGNTTWSYLANLKFDNLKPGRNVFEVVAINGGGYKSEPVTLTIIQGEGREGEVIDAPAGEGSNSSVSTGTASSSSSEERVEDLPTNNPLAPGSLRVTAPGEGSEFSGSEVEYLIEGVVPAQTHSVWVNDYKLRLYEPGKNFFNYIASIELGTMKRGANDYKIVARDSENKILDSFTYVIHFQVR